MWYGILLKKYLKFLNLRQFFKIANCFQTDKGNKKGCLIIYWIIFFTNLLIFSRHYQYAKYMFMKSLICLIFSDFFVLLCIEILIESNFWLGIYVPYILNAPHSSKLLVVSAGFANCECRTSNKYSLTSYIRDQSLKYWIIDFSYSVSVLDTRRLQLRRLRYQWGVTVKTGSTVLITYFLYL